MNPLLLCSATTLAERIKSRRATSVEVVEAHIAQVRKVNPHINAVVEDRFEQARAEARAADERVTSSKGSGLPPLHGVPCSVKESFGLVGMRNTGGLYDHRNVIADKDATAVARVRAAGAIPIGTTNVSELCMWMESDNCIYGRTGNPYDPSRTAGGSSGGEAAITGAAGAPFGLGSDIGGSIRLPAFFNGVFGHKCTGGLVPNTGQFPIAHGHALHYMTTGPICRRADDLMPLLRILAGPDDADGIVWPDALRDPAQVDLARVDVLVVRGNGVIPVSADMLEAQTRAARALQQAGARVREVVIPGLKHSLPIWAAGMHTAEGPTFCERMGSGKAINPFAELGRWTLRRSRHTLPAIGLGILEVLMDKLPGLESASTAAGVELKAELDHTLKPFTVILYPTYPTSAPRHYRPILPPVYGMYTAVFNAMELPVTQVPIGQDRNGIPLGVQVVGPRGRDFLPIAVARHLERACGGWHPPRLAR
ncbi:MAG: amidase [Deltaproteobacteria bacterium]|nr:amidase [Deltaproteobacteria bacterium]